MSGRRGGGLPSLRVTEAPTRRGPRERRGGRQRNRPHGALTGIDASIQTLGQRLHALGGIPPPNGNPRQNVHPLQKQWLADFDQDPLTSSIQPPPEPCGSPFT